MGSGRVLWLLQTDQYSPQTKARASGSLQEVNLLVTRSMALADFTGEQSGSLGELAKLDDKKETSTPPTSQFIILIRAHSKTTIR